MSQTPSQDPVDLVQTNETGHETTNTERMLSPNSISTQEDPPNPTSTQKDPPTTNTKRVPSSTPTPTQEDPPTSHQLGAHEPSQDTSTQSRSSPPIAVPSSKTDISSEPPTGTNAIPDGQDTQLEQTQLPNEDLGSSKDPLDAYDWAELEERFDAAMEKCAMREEGIQEEFNELINLFKTYTAIGSVHEEARAGKRLRTRMTYVQQREKTLEEKRTHFVKVVTAFENALALLSEP